MRVYQSIITRLLKDSLAGSVDCQSLSSGKKKDKARQKEKHKEKRKPSVVLVNMMFGNLVRQLNVRCTLQQVCSFYQIW